MKIALVSYEYPPETPTGGIGTYTVQLAELLSEAGMEVHVFAGSHAGSGTSLEGNLVVHRIHSTDPFAFRHRVVKPFATEQQRSPFDLVESPEINGNAWEIKKAFPHLPLHIRLHAGNQLVESLKKTYLPFHAKLRFVLGALKRGKWDLGYWRRYNPSKDPDYQFVKLADFISAPSVQMKEWAVKYWQLPPSKTDVLQNPFLENTGLQKARTQNQERVILFYGRLNVLKGLVTATRAMKKILKANPGWTWLVVGDDGFAPSGRGSMRNWMKKELKSLSAQVSFSESVSAEHLPSFLQQASIVIVPSLFESFSYVTLEALYAGKVLVGSGDTGIESLIQDRKNGLLADPFRSITWIKALQKLIDDPLLRENLGAEAIKSAEKRQETNQQIVAWYQSLANSSIYQPCG